MENTSIQSFVAYGELLGTELILTFIEKFLYRCSQYCCAASRIHI